MVSHNSLLRYLRWILSTVFRFNMNNCPFMEKSNHFCLLSWPKSLHAPQTSCSVTVTAWNDSTQVNSCSEAWTWISCCFSTSCVRLRMSLCAWMKFLMGPWSVCIFSALFIRRWHCQQCVPGALQQRPEGQYGELQWLGSVCGYVIESRRFLIVNVFIFLLSWSFWLFHSSSAFCFLPVSIPISRLTSRTLANPPRIISAAPTEGAASCLTLMIWAFQIWTL